MEGSGGVGEIRRNRNRGKRQRLIINYSDAARDSAGIACVSSFRSTPPPPSVGMHPQNAFVFCVLFWFCLFSWNDGFYVPHWCDSFKGTYRVTNKTLFIAYLQVMRCWLYTLLQLISMPESHTKRMFVRKFKTTAICFNPGQTCVRANRFAVFSVIPSPHLQDKQIDWVDRQVCPPYLTNTWAIISRFSVDASSCPSSKHYLNLCWWRPHYAHQDVNSGNYA